MRIEDDEVDRGPVWRPTRPRSHQIKQAATTPEVITAGVVSSLRLREDQVRRRWWIFLIGLLAACGGFWAFDVWRLRADWQQAQRDVATGKPASALPGWPGWRPAGLVTARFSTISGSASWPSGMSTVPRRHGRGCLPTRRIAARAAMMRARQALKVHRLSAAEPLLPAALDDPGEFGKEARETLVHLYKLQGRFDEARRLVREGWGRYDRVGTIQELVRLDTSNPIPIEKVQPILETAARAAPDDDRIWLGWANLATRHGPIRRRHAAGWTAASTAGLTIRPSGESGSTGPAPPKTRPRSGAPWRICHPTEFPGPRCSPSAPGLLAVPATPNGSDAPWRNWSSATRGALAAMESLAELLLRTGRPEKAKQLRARKGELERTLDWYMVNIFPANRLEHATELARAAEAVGRRFEAHCWWELAAEQSAHAAMAKAELARLDREAMSAGPLPPV